MIVLSGKVYFYKGAYKVKVVTESEGYWLVEALEDFVDYVDDERIMINAGQRRLVPPDVLNSQLVEPSMTESAVEHKKETRGIRGTVENARDRQKVVDLSGKTC